MTTSRSRSSSSTESDLLEVGRIDRAHGLRGDVIVTLTTNRTERLAPGAVLRTDRGTLEVAAARPHQHRHLVTFAEIADRTDAEGWAGTVLLAEAIDDPGALWVHQLVGASVTDQQGQALGTVRSVEANPASDLLVLDGGGLVPLRFVTEVGDGVVVVDVPDGLLDPSPPGE